jgi:hypothetical protein
MKASTFYIQRNGQGYLETVDEFTSKREARAMLAEYRMSDPSADYYLSSRPCKAWEDSKRPAAGGIMTDGYLRETQS